MNDESINYRASFEALADDPDWQELSATAQAVFQTLKLKLGRYGIGVFYVSSLREYHRKSAEADLLAALVELECNKPSGSKGWIRRERTVIWIRNGLRFEPSLRLENGNHCKGALRHAKSLPKSAVVDAFIAYYELADAESVVTGRPKKEINDKSTVNPISAPDISPVNHEDGDEEGNSTTTTSSPPPPPGSREIVGESGSVEANTISIATRLENRRDRDALQRIAEAAPDSLTWLGDMASALNHEEGHPHLTAKQLGDALRAFVGNGGVKRKGMSYSLFRGYLRNAANPPPASSRRRPSSSRDPAAKDFTPRAPLKADEEVRWAR